MFSGWHVQSIYVNMHFYVSLTVKYLLLKLTKKTRVCLRDAFYRLAESSEAQCTAANGGTITSSDEQSFQQSEGIGSRYIYTTLSCLRDQLYHAYILSV
jgi:hypothetical protein